MVAGDVNVFATTCIALTGDADNAYECVNCTEGHGGKQCEECLPDFFGVPTDPNVREESVLDAHAGCFTLHWTSLGTDVFIVFAAEAKREIYICLRSHSFWQKQVVSIFFTYFTEQWRGMHTMFLQRQSQHLQQHKWRMPQLHGKYWWNGM